MSLSVCCVDVYDIVVPKDTRDSVFFRSGDVIFRPCGSCVGIAEVRRSELADDNGDIFIREVFAHIREERVKLVCVCRSERLVSGHIGVRIHREIIRRISVKRNADIIIVRNFKIAVYVIISGSAVIGHHQKSCVLVRRLDGADCVDKILIQFVYDFIAGLISRPLYICSGGSRFIHSLKDKVLVIVGKICRDLCPELFEFRRHIIVGRREIGPVYPLLVVNVQDNVHSVVIGVVNDFFDTREPLLADIEVSVNVLIPCYGNSYRVEALCLDGGNKLFRCLGVAPRGLGIESRVGSGACRLERIAEIPAHFHIFRYLKRLHDIRRRDVLASGRKIIHCRKHTERGRGGADNAQKRF